MVELYQLRQLLAVAEYGTLSAAAGALHISQSALTRSMQKLERELSASIFDRKRNRVTLNETGQLAVEHARQILSAMECMMNRIHAYSRALTAIVIGSCAPAPMWEIASGLILRYADRTIISEMKETDALLKGLENGEYQMIILDRPVKEEGIICKKYGTERLLLSLPPTHPLAARENIRLCDLAGETMLLYADLGVWKKVCEEKMNQIHFIIQEQRETFEELVCASGLPNFTTHLSRRSGPLPTNRVEIPILDPEAAITFYLCVPEKRRDLLEAVLLL